MLRRLFTLLSTASLVLCVATSVLWARSYWYEDSARYWGCELAERHVHVRVTSFHGLLWGRLTLAELAPEERRGYWEAYHWANSGQERGFAVGSDYVHVEPADRVSFASVHRFRAERA
ncbi:MAG: hypothetical protein JWO31_1231, partial [Phycisphaerales bacterium]|nr:hypothetical protein [Phycisphaerales bacterium]